MSVHLPIHHPTIRYLLSAWVFIGAGSCARPEPSPIPQAAEDTLEVGTARVDITPDYPVRLSGFGFRRTESEGVRQRIWAKALAFGGGKTDPAVLVTVDNLAIPDDLVENLASRLKDKAGVPRGRLAVTATHTHTAPMLKDALPTLFGLPIPADHQERIDRYTRELSEKLEEVTLAALKDRRPARLSWGIGRVDFAANRRTKGGPVDHDLPLLAVKDLEGKLRALYVSYACHCVTLSDNKVSGDWAGYAQEHLEREYPGIVALCSAGCGADSNPSSGVTGAKAEIASRQGTQVADEVKRLLGGRLRPVEGPISAKLERVDLPLADPPTRQQWEETAKRSDAAGHHARVQLARLDRGEDLRTRISYPVQTWAFGDGLAMVFLAGEVVVDYSLRLKTELDGRRLWVNAYSNASPCYIPSERVLREGGYEGGGAMIYYDQPSRFRPGLEPLIVDAVRRQIGGAFASPVDASRTQGSRPLSPEQSLAAIRTKPEFTVDLVAAEPLVIDPVAIDFGPDGALWVVEMHDYPMGMDGKYRPGGRIRVLRDTHGDGVYDKATVFLDSIPFPTGVTVWRKGVLVSAAPDILYAEDTDGDDRADVVRKAFTGFGTGNYQARVNGLEYGLDGWVYGSCGLFGGRISSSAGGEPIGLGDRDFRMNPDTGVLQPATGRTQQGRVRDDWGNWFGCDNSNFCRHYPLPDHYLRRNPHLSAPANSVSIDPGQVFPARTELQRFAKSGAVNRVTAACGLGIYRDDLLGPEVAGNAFCCEPVYLAVHRMALSPEGATFSGRRAADESQSEFLSSVDNWFRPVQVRTGPDGALWVVDMYRHVIEHPRWIPAADLAKVDVRAGDTMGRIYRVRPKDRPLRKPPRLDKLDTVGLVAALDTPNGWQRDMATQMLLWRGDKTASKPLEEMALANSRAEARLHALSALDGLGELKPEVVLRALGDTHAGIRRHAVRLSEKFVAASADIGPALLKLVDDPDAQVRLQLALSLGEWRDPRAGGALVALAKRGTSDATMIAAILSSLRPENLGEVAANVLSSAPPPEALLRPLSGMAIALGDQATWGKVLAAVVQPRPEGYERWQMATLANSLEALERHGRLREALGDERVGRMLIRARAAAADDKVPEAERLVALELLGRDPGGRDRDLALLGALLAPQMSAPLQAGAVDALGRVADDRVPGVLTAGWKGHTPAQRSKILDLLLSRGGWQRQLLASLERGDILPGHIDASRRRRLLEHKDPGVREAATRLFAGGTSPDRRKVLEEYREATTLAGDLERGKAVFLKSCAPCHQLGELGRAVGPDLTPLSNKAADYMLIAILDPNLEVDGRYIQYVAKTKDGGVYDGILAVETATSVTLRTQDGNERVLLRRDLEALQSTGKSLMPEGVEKDLSKQSLADLIAFLRETR